MFSNLFASLLASTALPIFGSYRALQKNDQTLLRSWLMYWVVISLQFSLETYFGFLVTVLPFFQFFRFLFILWLVLPQTQGASQIYENHIATFLELHERQIDVYVYNACNNIKILGADYLARFLHYAKEYAAHYTMNTEIHPYSPPAQPEPSHVGIAASPSAAGSSFIDNFFSKYKQPPSYSHVEESPTEVSSSHNSPPEPPLWKSMVQLGVSAINYSMQLPKRSADPSRDAPPPAVPSSTGSFGSMMNQLEHQLTGTPSAPASRSVSGVSTTGRDAPSLSVPHVRSGVDIPKAPSTSSLNDFDIIKYDESVAPSGSGDENDSLLSHATHHSHRSSSWFKWKKDEAEEHPAKPVKLD